ncbi:hypothetical protein BX616_003122, partial [Lobosporangium transversale]
MSCELRVLMRLEPLRVTTRAILNHQPTLAALALYLPYLLPQSSSSLLQLSSLRMHQPLTFLVAILAIVNVAMAALLPNGYYRISIANRYITTKTGSAGFWPATYQASLPTPGYHQVWYLRNYAGNKITLSTRGHQPRYLSLSPLGAREYAYLAVSGTSQRWTLEKAGDKYKIVYPVKVHGKWLNVD